LRARIDSRQRLRGDRAAEGARALVRARARARCARKGTTCVMGGHDAFEVNVDPLSP
jgi:hypothetical protein